MKQTNFNIRGATRRIFESKELDERLFIVGEIVASSARASTGRIDTGRMKGSIIAVTRFHQGKLGKGAHKDDEIERPSEPGICKVGTNVFYAWFHEFGTKHIKRHAMIRRGIAYARHSVRRVL